MIKVTFLVLMDREFVYYAQPNLRIRYIFIHSLYSLEYYLEELSYQKEEVVISNFTSKISKKSNIYSFGEFKTKYQDDTSSEILIKKSASPKKITFYASNDTHVKTYIPLINKLDVPCQVLISRMIKENAEGILRKYKIPFEFFTEGVLQKFNPDIVLLSNDWAPQEQLLINECSNLGITTVSLQEGCLDFGYKKTHFLEWCDYTFITGIRMSRYLNNKFLFITGNPRFDEFPYKEIKNTNHKAMANVNFTYGIYENARDSWIDDVFSACRDAGVSLFFSQHPRDRKVFDNTMDVRKSGADVLENQLDESTILISRFSTLFYEASIVGNNVIYHNPHKEKMRIFNEDDSGWIFKSDSKGSLADALSKILHSHVDSSKRSQFLINHLDYNGTKSVEKIVQSLMLINNIKDRDLKNNRLKKPSIYPFLKTYLYIAAQKIGLR